MSEATKRIFISNHLSLSLSRFFISSLTYFCLEGTFAYLTPYLMWNISLFLPISGFWWPSSLDSWTWIVWRAICTWKSGSRRITSHRHGFEEQTWWFEGRIAYWREQINIFAMDQTNIRNDEDQEKCLYLNFEERKKRGRVTALVAIGHKKAKVGTKLKLIYCSMRWAYFYYIIIIIIITIIIIILLLLFLFVWNEQVCNPATLQKWEREQKWTWDKGVLAFNRQHIHLYSPSSCSWLIALFKWTLFLINFWFLMHSFMSLLAEWCSVCMCVWVYVYVFHYWSVCVCVYEVISVRCEYVSMCTRPKIFLYANGTKLSLLLPLLSLFLFSYYFLCSFIFFVSFFFFFFIINFLFILFSMLLW